MKTLRVRLRNVQTIMLRVSEFDKVFNEAQRQGRISFYLTSRGEEASSPLDAPC